MFLAIYSKLQNIKRDRAKAVFFYVRRRIAAHLLRFCLRCGEITYKEYAPARELSLLVAEKRETLSNATTIGSSLAAPRLSSRSRFNERS